MEHRENTEDFLEVLEEIKDLCYSANSEIIRVFVQKHDRPDPATLVGKGKVEEIKQAIEEDKPDLVIFMNDLKPTQQRNLSEELKTKVIDRQGLILDIFSQRARSHEGKMQVELALLNYLLPRLAGLGPVLSRLGGGIGTRGPGEKMLETDKRHVMRRIETLRSDLKKVRSHRGLLRESRRNKGFLMAALVGYTNTGKSTILNLLTHRDSKVEDKLFATLDPTVGKFYVGSGVEVLLVDTVGFIRRLPHNLAAAFRATLEEIEDADVVIHIVDVSHKLWQEHLKVTEQVLEEMASDNKPSLVFLNKTDLLTPLELQEAREILPEAIPVSALKNEGFEEATTAILDLIETYFSDFVNRFRKEDGYKWSREFETKQNEKI